MRKDSHVMLIISSTSPKSYLVYNGPGYLSPEISPVLETNTLYNCSFFQCITEIITDLKYGSLFHYISSPLLISSYVDIHNATQLNSNFLHMCVILVIAVCIYHYVITLGLWKKYDIDGHYSRFATCILANPCDICHVAMLPVIDLLGEIRYHIVGVFGKEVPHIESVEVIKCPYGKGLQIQYNCYNENPSVKCVKEDVISQSQQGDNYFSILSTM